MDLYIKDYQKYIENGLWTNAINKAISDLGKNDRLIFNGNSEYKSGTIFLKNDITIYLEENAILKACDDIDSFNVKKSKLSILKGNSFNNCDYNGKPSLFFIYGMSLNNVTIDGSGIIDGNEKIFYGKVTDTYIEGKFYPRMPLLYLENIKNLTIKNITIRNSAFWTVHLVGCDGVLIDSINIKNNRKMLNADGIDPDHTKNITIRNCNIESADDCIVLKTTEAFKQYGDVYNVNISNCNLKSTSAAIKIGTETCSGFRNISIDNVTITDTNRAISFQERDEGYIDGVNISNISIETHMVDPLAYWGKAEAISITCVRRNENKKCGYVKNVSFKNIKAHSEHGIFIYGKDISDISFENIDLNIINVTDYNKDIYDLRPHDELPQFEKKNSLIYVEMAQNVSFKDLKTTGCDLIIGDIKTCQISDLKTLN